jgi:hypothetical protein
MSDDTLSTLNVSATDNDKTEVVISENETLVALRVADEEALVAKMAELEGVLLNDTASLEEKNKAYEEIQSINKNESMKTNIEKQIKEEFKLDSYVSISEKNIKVTIASKNHDTTLANNIIRSIQNLYKSDMYITVKFG